MLLGMSPKLLADDDDDMLLLSHLLYCASALLPAAQEQAVFVNMLGQINAHLAAQQEAAQR